MKNVFERADAENEAIQTAETTENEENIALSEAFEEVEQVEVCDEPDGDNSSSAQIEAPPIPKRCFEKENNGKCIVQYVKYLIDLENDSGVSSGGENPGESKNQFSTPLQVYSFRNGTSLNTKSLANNNKFNYNQSNYN